MDISSFDKARPHIEEYLRVGKEKLETAIILKKSKKYPNAITEYIGAYEEIGQALFLTDKISHNEEITENDLKKYIKPASHAKKILAHYITRKEQMAKNSDEAFEKIKKSEIGELFRNPYTREKTIDETNKRISIYSKLNKLRQTFDYSHDLSGQITTHDYAEDDLDSLCYLLESECLTSYYQVKLNLEGRSIRSPNYTDETVLSKIASLPSIKELTELNKKSNTKNNQRLKRKGLRFINSF